ncbi:peptide/nickel transport system substrate-binding protein [Natronoarchaeum philippinense]|uniref:Peptide/nickel transport system substrate-binding protein n=1 Tax=Natronoarchaeum philippinense TaxID=558529 RepID=A0A285N4E2_NATPI|nr:ABC transporter substrate-binding protein [Natronoarchaeum philippinense]SNZ04309.1 peptide/nickel transport system substrate-binding protein [Natronoarchaeum philippinense]
MPSSSPGPRRRELLGALGASALGSTAGCTNLLSQFAWDSPNDLSLTIATVPASVDTAAIQMARQLEQNLQRAGINATYEPQSEASVLRSALMDNDFDLFIARHPGVDDPDKLRTMLHTRYSEEAGWQNPFGFTAPSVDELLVTQRSQTGQQRHETVTEIQDRLYERQPFSVLAYPDQLTVASTELDLERTPNGLIEAPDYLKLGTANPSFDRLRVGILGATLTRNRNPIAVDYHSRTKVLDLIYEPLVEQVGDDYIPWVAANVEWDATSGPTTARVTLRENLAWHDGERLDADDVAFTYRFLQDTAMGNESAPVPAPLYRSRSSLVNSVSVQSDRVIELEFGDTSRPVARRALTVPLFPRHVWTQRTEVVRTYMTQALVWENKPAIGSGPYRFENASAGNRLVLSKNEDHFLFDGRSLGDRYAPFTAGGSFEELRFDVIEQSLLLIGSVEDDTIDIGASPIWPEHAEGAKQAPNAELLSGGNGEFYMLGFNTRRHPLNNHQFRTAVARLIDREYAVEEMMYGHAEPADSPLVQTEYLPEQFAWDGQPTFGAFPGDAGEVDPESAKELFRDAGFRYDDSGKLVTQN